MGEDGCPTYGNMERTHAQYDNKPNVPETNLLGHLGKRKLLTYGRRQTSHLWQERGKNACAVRQQAKRSQDVSTRSSKQENVADMWE